MRHDRVIMDAHGRPDQLQACGATRHHGRSWQTRRVTGDAPPSVIMDAQGRPDKLQVMRHHPSSLTLRADQTSYSRCATIRHHGRSWQTRQVTGDAPPSVIMDAHGRPDKLQVMRHHPPSWTLMADQTSYSRCATIHHHGRSWHTRQVTGDAPPSVIMGAHGRPDKLQVMRHHPLSWTLMADQTSYSRCATIRHHGRSWHTRQVTGDAPPSVIMDAHGRPDKLQQMRHHPSSWTLMADQTSHR
ncbi:hypothetical protein DPMN_139209 [Dreissena polymorpha]|uniref:Uncharacterized protein n=1 Tax=Dreissena polymorpha TaxID=45954 RepID=A0A9D4G5K4_DREPO|nr:hypothetical protein DPMN_139209 [Dreissena polymorpha]